MDNRKTIIENILKSFAGIRISAFYFQNKDLPYIKYWYDEVNDSLATEFLSIPFNCKTEEIDAEYVYNLLDHLEDDLITYFKTEKNVRLLVYDD
jgi:hypothetical protein